MASDLIDRPDLHEERAVARAFLRLLPDHYEIAEVILFGSRARGDHRPDSDLDLAIVLKGRRKDFIDTKIDMAGFAFDILMRTGVLVQPFPMPAATKWLAGDLKGHCPARLHPRASAPSPF